MDAARSSPPRGLLVAVGALALQGLALTGFGAWLGYESVVAEASNERVAAGSATYFALLGPLVLLLGWALWRRRSFALGAAVFVQLVALGVAFEMWQGGFVAGAVLLTLAALAALVGLVQPATRVALGRS